MTDIRTLTPEQQQIVAAVDGVVDGCDVNDTLEALSAVLVALLVSYAPTRADALTAARDIGRTLRQTVRHAMTDADESECRDDLDGNTIQ